MKEAFGEELLKQFRKEKRLLLFGRPSRICSNIKQELDDVLLVRTFLYPYTFFFFEAKTEH